MMYPITSFLKYFKQCSLKLLHISSYSHGISFSRVAFFKIFLPWPTVRNIIYITTHIYIAETNVLQNVLFIISNIILSIFKYNAEKPQNNSKIHIKNNGVLGVTDIYSGIEPGPFLSTHFLRSGVLGIIYIQ